MIFANFLRKLRNGVFLKNQFYDPLFAGFRSVLRQNANFFGKNIFKIKTSVPWVDGMIKKKTFFRRKKLKLKWCF
jgi:hypothetical protein